MTPFPPPFDGAISRFHAEAAPPAIRAVLRAVDYRLRDDAAIGAPDPRIVGGPGMLADR
jgi:hypothetical protein